jgi:hypothetical protein
MSCGRSRGVFALATIFLVVSIVVAGCGGDSKPLTEAEFVKQGNEICEAATKERSEVTKELSKQGGSGGAKEGEEATEELLDPVRKMTEELADLSPPEGQEKKVEAIVAAFEAGISKVEAEPAGSKTAFAFSKANQLAAESGLTSCSV